MSAVYKRIIIKLSGEALAGNKDEREGSFDKNATEAVAKAIIDVAKQGVEVGVVVGGGNIWRGRFGEGMDDVTADHMGMLATVINALYLRDALERQGMPTRVQTAIEMRQLAEPYIRGRAVRHLEKGRVVIFAAGTGNPHFTTDTAAALRASEVNADAILKCTTVDTLFDSDPHKNPDAKPIIDISSASVGILEMLAIQGLVPLETSLYIIMGTNIGTCVTAMLSAVGATRTAKRAALIHLMFNVLGTLVVFILVSLLPVSTWIGHINGPALQIAVAHTSFKVFEVLCFVLLRKWLVKLVMILVPGEDKQGEGKSLKFLDDRILSTPPIAVAQICKEIERMGDIAIANLTRAMDAFFNKDSSLINEVEQSEDVVNYLNHEITRYMVAAAQLDLPASDVEQLGEMFHVVNDLERIGDHAENMAEYANSRIEEEIPFSEDGLAELRDMLDKTVALFKLSMEAFHTRDQHLLPRVLVQEENIDDMEKTLQQSHVDRLTRGACTPRSGMIFSDMLSNLERVADHATNVAFSIQADQTVT